MGMWVVMSMRIDVANVSGDVAVKLRDEIPHGLNERDPVVENHAHIGRRRNVVARPAEIIPVKLKR